MFSTSPLYWCSPCGAEQFFDSPPCEDGHGEECLDLACTVCGHAIVVGVVYPATEVRRADRAA